MNKKKSFSWQINTVIFSIIFCVIIYIGISIYLGWHDIVLIFSKIGWWGLWIALLLSLFNYILRFIRWQIYLKKLGYSIPYKDSWKIYLSGFALTTTPGKAGETIRSFFLKERGVPISASLAAFISERLSDLIAIVLLSCIGLMQYSVAQIPVCITVFFILFMWFMMAYPPILKFLQNKTYGKTGKFWLLSQKLVDIIQQMQRCHNLGSLSITTLISIIAWGAEALAFYLLLYWSGFDLGFNFAVFVYAIAMLAGALSFLPGGLGGAEATMVSLLMLKQLDMQSAFALTIFIRFTTLWFAVILGMIALAQLKLHKKHHHV